MKKRITAGLLALSLCLALTSCGSKKTKQPGFDGTAVGSDLTDTLIAQNSSFKMEWDSVTRGVTLTELSTGQQWGTSPTMQQNEELDAMGMPVKKNEMVNSAVLIQYSLNGETAEAYSYDGAVTNGVVRCAKIKNGLRVEYFFSEPEIMIPVNYVLHNNYVSATVEPAEIQENGNMVTRVSIAPFWCSAKNDTENAYLMFPSGSGALIPVKTLSQQGERLSERVYGDDASMLEWYTPTNRKNILLPVYGVSTGNTATLAVIDGGADQAIIEAIVGSVSHKYSSVYASFQVRGYTNNITPIFNDTDVSDIYDKTVTDSKFSVRFYPLSGENANYSGMAKIYREYLKNEYGLSRSKKSIAPNINIIGGTKITKSFLGIPYESVYSSTTAAQAEKIITELSKEIKITAVLKGFGESGIDIGKLGGGFKTSGRIASASEMKKLAEKAKSSGSDTYMDFDIVRFSKSGGGFSAYFNTTVNAAGKKAVKYLSDKAVHDDVKETLYYLITPSKLENAGKKAGNAVKKYGFGGVSLSTLSQMSWSDYSEKNTSEFHSATGFSETAKKAITAAKQNKNGFAATAPNLYAALSAERITEAPLTSSKENIFSDDIPFYEMVFSGYIPMSGESANLSENADDIILRSVEAGCAVGYTVIGDWSNKLIDSQYPLFYSTVFSNMKEEIIDTSGRLNDYYRKINGAEVKTHTIIHSGLRKTVFSNGVTVYVNYNNYPENTEAGQVAAADFLIKEGAE